MCVLQKISVKNTVLQNGTTIPCLVLSFQFFGKPLGTAPIVLVNHALTGNSQVAGEKGWWNSLVGEDKTIDTNKYSVIAFNIPGNGYDGFVSSSIENYKDFTTYDIAALFWKGLDFLSISRLYGVIGGSLGGAIAWEMAAQRPTAIQHLIPVAADWKATDWLIANVLVQDSILNNSNNPIHDARLHAMLLYRTPESLQYKFQRKLQNDSDLFQIESWLLHHGKKLEERFQLSAYKLMNHLLKTIAVAEVDNQVEILSKIQSDIHLIAVDTDYFFTASENKKTVEALKPYKSNIHYHEINSIHGHDAFLIEYEQLNNILKSIF